MRSLEAPEAVNSEDSHETEAQAEHHRGAVAAERLLEQHAHTKPGEGRTGDQEPVATPDCVGSQKEEPKQRWDHTAPDPALGRYQEHESRHNQNSANRPARSLVAIHISHQNRV